MVWCRRAGSRGDATPTGTTPSGPVPSPCGTNGIATAALVCGILWPFCVTAILAIIFGQVGMGPPRRP